MGRKVLAIVGSYRRGGITDTLVDEALASAREHGAETEKIILIERHIKFCRNCRTCTQEPGGERGRCVHDDDMDGILAQCDHADALVLASPVNFFNVTAVTRRFMERLVCAAYWPWGKPGPEMRKKEKTKQAVLITGSAMPGFLGRLFTGAVRALRITAEMLGAKPIATIFSGLGASAEKQAPSAKALRKAREAGRKLAAG